MQDFFNHPETLANENDTMANENDTLANENDTLAAKDGTCPQATASIDELQAFLDRFSPFRTTWLYAIYGRPLPLKETTSAEVVACAPPPGQQRNTSCSMATWLAGEVTALNKALHRLLPRLHASASALEGLLRRTAATPLSSHR